MKTRKIVLLGAVVVLACALVIELLTTPSGSVKSLALREKPDSILIEKGGGKLLLSKEGDKWLVGEKKYPADPDRVDLIVKSIGTLKVFDSLGTGDESRFGFGEKEGMTVTALLGGKELRRLAVGKATSTSRQSYVRLDGGKDILLVSGNLVQDFGVGESELREKRMFTFTIKDVGAVEVQGKEHYALSKSGESAAWKVERPASLKDRSIDAAKVDSWLAALAGLRAGSFAPEGPAPSGEPYGVVSLTLGSRKATLTVHAKAGDSGYLCSSSESPYLFYVSDYDITRCLKPMADLFTK